MRKQRENPQMDAKKAEALAALSSARTLTEAAQLAGISRTTLWAYLKDKQFNDELQAFQTMRAWLRADQMEALRAIMTDPEAPAASRVNAAQQILREAQRATDGAITANERTALRCANANIFRNVWD